MRRSLGLILSVSLVFVLVEAAGVLAQSSAQSSNGAPTVATPQKERPVTPNTYGTVTTSYTQVSQAAFLPFDSGRAWTTTNFGVNPGGATRYGTTLTTDFNAPVSIPAGAQITYLELDYCDTNAGANYVLGTFVACNFLGNNCVKYPTSGTSSAGYLTSQDGVRGGCSQVNIDMTPFNINVDNFLNHYLLDTITTATDGTNSFAGMIVGYKLQVSPAPGTATFTDVPLSDFAFQFVEAFNKAGITVGCNASPPMFCPDRNVTRREMAVFFAKALGLQSP
jgi:hypothetical protein